MWKEKEIKISRDTKLCLIIRRIELKKERSETAVAHETRESPTYSLSIDCSIQENPAVDLTKILDPYPVPVPAKLPSNNTKYNLVYFDLETP